MAAEPGLRWICLDCAARQADPGACRACKRDEVLDSTNVEVLELMRDVETRLAAQRDRRFRALGAIVGIAVIVPLWAIPGYWTLRQAYGLPFLLDQWLLMALIGLGLSVVLGRSFDKPKFPYLDANNLTIS